MELFAAAGIELPPSGGSGGRSRRGVLRTLRAPLFNYKVVQKARELLAFAPSVEQVKAAQDYARKVSNPKFLKQKETAVRNLFIQEILQTVLGYRTYDPAESYTIAFEKQIRGGAVDVALGKFGRPDPDDLIAPFELKGPGTDDLDRLMPGRGRSPVQQAWDYAIDAPGSRWVLVSNCIEIRLYGFGRGRDAYELFDLTRLAEPEEHARLWLILSADRLLGGATDLLLRETDSAYKDITNELYRQYKDLRERLIGFLADSADGPKLAALQAIEIAQKVLDRILFIAFAQRTDLLPDRLLEDASKDQNRFVPQPIWMNFLALFRAVDGGNDRLAVWAYNGGLFAEDPLADVFVLPDPLAQDVAKLGQWDYRREVPVTVLGHIFEQSISDIEMLKAQSKGEAPPEISRRKREGVVYTPDIVTRFLVERTIGLSLDETRTTLWNEHEMREAKAGEAGPSAKQEIAFWSAYLAALRDFTIIDPACGSGAFLVAAFDEMARRYRDVVSRLAELGVEIKIAAGKKTLGEVYGPPLYGIKTGLNDAFVIDRATRDRLVKADPKSADVLKPFLRGEDIKRWRVESGDLFLINTPKGKVDIEAYPAIRDWLLPFRSALEKRATKQEWWELQQAQLAYQPSFAGPKISYPHFQNERMFTLEETGAFSNDKSYFIPTGDLALLYLLNSMIGWFFLTAISPAVRNNWHEMRVQYVEKLPIPDFPNEVRVDLALGQSCTEAARNRFAIQSAVRHRMLDLAPPERRKLTGRLENWHEFDFAVFIEEVKKAFHADIPVKQRGDWEAYLAENGSKVRKLTAEIARAESEIDTIVYKLFDLTAEEIALLEASLADRF